VEDGLKTRSVTAAGDASVIMGNRAVSCPADQGWEGCASARKMQAYSNSGAIGSSFLITVVRVSVMEFFPNNKKKK
jgi:hypothetical protein